MSLWSRLRVFMRGAGSLMPGIQSDSPGSGKLTKRSVTSDSALQLSAVFACVRLITETIGALPIKAYDVQPDGTRKLNNDHPIIKLLGYRPNRYQTRVEFWESVVFQLAMHGNSYIKIVRKEDEIISAMPMPSMQVSMRWLDDGTLVYEYETGAGVEVLAAQSVWHVKLFGNGLIGLSPMECARNAIGIAISNEDRVSRMANNGFKPSGILMIDKLLKPEQREAIRANFAELTEGNSDSLRILEAGMTYAQTTMNPKDVQLLETRRFQLEDIARFFGVPSVLINDTAATTVWGSGIQQIVEGFYKLGLRPYLERFEASIQRWLISPDDRGKLEIEFDFDALLRGDFKTRIDAYGSAVLNGLKSVNECRRAEGDPPVDGGDQVYMQGQMTPLSRLANPETQGATP